MKKQLILFSAMIIAMSNPCFGVTKQDIITQNKSASKKALPKKGEEGKAFYSAINQEGINDWYKALDKIKSFVDEHSKNVIGQKDSVLLKTTSELEKLTLDVINAIKITRGSLASKSGLLVQNKKLEDLIEKTGHTFEKLQSESFTLPSKKESKAVLLAALDNLETVARNAEKALMIIVKTL